MHKQRITIYPDAGYAFDMIFTIPEDRDDEEYIEGMLSEIFSDNFSWTEWNFAQYKDVKKPANLYTHCVHIDLAVFSILLKQCVRSK